MCKALIVCCTINLLNLLYVQGTLRDNLLYPRHILVHVQQQYSRQHSHQQYHRHHKGYSGRAGDSERLLGEVEAAATEVEEEKEEVADGSSAAEDDLLVDLHRVLGVVGLESFRAFLPTLNRSSSCSSSSRREMSSRSKLRGGSGFLLPQAQPWGPASAKLTTHLLSHYSVGSRSSSSRWFNSFTQVRKEREDAVLGEEEDGVEGAARDWARTISLGEQQRLTVARALLRRPTLVCFSFTLPFFLPLESSRIFILTAPLLLLS